MSRKKVDETRAVFRGLGDTAYQKRKTKDRRAAKGIRAKQLGIHGKQLGPVVLDVVLVVAVVVVVVGR